VPADQLGLQQPDRGLGYHVVKLSPTEPTDGTIARERSRFHRVHRFV